MTKFSGEINQKFIVWLDANFGFYSQGILVDTAWDVNLIYQFEEKRNALKSWYQEIELSRFNKWEIIIDNDTFYLNLYEDDIKWFCFQTCWINEKKPDYVDFDYLIKGGTSEKLELK